MHLFFPLSVACMARAHLVAKIRSPGYKCCSKEREKGTLSTIVVLCSSALHFLCSLQNHIRESNFASFQSCVQKTSSSFSSVCLKVACNFANYVEMHAFTSRKQQHFKLLWFALIRPTFAKRTDSTTQWSAILKKNWTI